MERADSHLPDLAPRYFLHVDHVSPTSHPSLSPYSSPLHRRPFLSSPPSSSLSPAPANGPPPPKSSTPSVSGRSNRTGP